MRRTWRWLACLVALGVAGGALGDTRLTLREGSEVASADVPPALRESLGGGETRTVTVWLRADRWARVGESGRLVSRLDRGESYLIDDRAKTYRVLPTGVPEALAEARPRFEKTGERRRFGSWEAERVEMTLELAPGETIAGTLWISGDVGIDEEAYRAFLEGAADRMGMAWLRGLAALGGYPVRQEVSVGPVTTWEELVAVGEESPPAGVYEPPKGYERLE
jgi:hypothetical protein